MRSRAIHIYVGAVCALAAVVLFTVDWQSVLSHEPAVLWGLATLIFLGLVSESLAMSFEVGRSSGQASITFLPLLAGVVLFGPSGAVVFMLVTGIVGEFFLRKKPPIRAVFNNAQWVSATVVAGWVFNRFSGEALVQGAEVTSALIPFVAFTLTFLALNHSAVALAISLSQGENYLKVLRAILGPTGTNLLYDLLVSPLALGVAVLYQRAGWLGLVIAILPLLFVRRSYQTSRQLQRANRDLLRALVKAIETRDPYTSGHSVRVSGLARRIAISLGLPRRRVEAVANAALLHDIGKIDAVYVEILRKPDSLSPEEREIIESHVTKGVELLTSLSSFSQEVIAAVRHHHEREDGKGYPDRLKGSEIPLGAKIIKVCDAVDAMLSDRPYRSALSIEQVKEQLVTYAGIQFAPAVVESIIGSTVLEDHKLEVELGTASQSAYGGEVEGGGRQDVVESPMPEPELATGSG